MNSPRRAGEYQFVPRVINPVKLKRAVLFAADAQLRQAMTILESDMPWLRTEVVSDPRRLTDASSGEASVFLFDDTGLAVADAAAVRERNERAVLVLLSFQPFVQCAPPRPASERFPYTAKADLVFAVSQAEFAPRSILPAAVRAAEDRLNIELSSGIRRFIFHVVDDEPRWFSQFLPLLYSIIGQRADVMITRTFEESLRFLFGVEEERQISGRERPPRGHGDDVVCLIADIFLPRGNDLQSDAGRALIRLVNARFPRIPVIIASKAKEALELKDLGFILPKGDPDSLARLKDQILNFTGLGDFLIYDKNGREILRAKDIGGIGRIVLEAEKDTPEGSELREILESYGEKDRFSTWLYMHSYSELGDRLRPRRGRGRQLITLLKRNFQAEIARSERTPLIFAGEKIFSLDSLLTAIRKAPPERLQPLSDNDVISSWLDRQGFTELAEELRPIHGSGETLKQTLTEVIARWAEVYRKRALAE
jgi:hypothetical protein